MSVCCGCRCVQIRWCPLASKFWGVTPRTGSVVQDSDMQIYKDESIVFMFKCLFDP